MSGSISLKNRGKAKGNNGSQGTGRISQANAIPPVQTFKPMNQR